MKFLLFSCLISFLFPTLNQAQTSYPKDYFRPPLDTIILLVGNFGEIRPNHFHTGLDIRTGNREGMKVNAVADGYVSKIKISPVGYGKMLYITHPNGFVSVYAHLQSFNEPIGEYLKTAQYTKESFEIEVLPNPKELQVNKGDFVALSGNTGSSTGPHLHFEMRDEKSEQAYNPLLFGFGVKDTSVPFITGLYLYQFNDSIYEESPCDRSTLPQKLGITGGKGIYKLSSGKPLPVFDNAGFGIEVYDKQNGTDNRNSMYSIELKLDGERIYFQEMEKVLFDQNRYINAHIDYYEQKTKGRNIQKSFLAHNNQLKIYKEIKNRGIINLHDNNLHKIEYEIKDINGNTSVLSFQIKKNITEQKPKYPISCVATYNCEKENVFKTPNVEILFPKNTFYENLKFDYPGTSGKILGAFSPTHHIHNRYVPIHSYYTLSIKTDSIPMSLRSKAVIVSLDEKGNKHYEGGEWDKGFVTTQTRSFGDFTVVIDNTAPYIGAVNIKNGKNMKYAKSIACKIGDNLSGIKSYRGTIDGKWILMEYEPKKNLLFYTFEGNITQGKHTFILEVRDNKDNVNTYKAEFIR